MQLQLSSQTWQKISGGELSTGRISGIGFIRFKNGMTLFIACDRAIYLASVILSAIYVCSLLHQVIGNPAYVITNPVRKRTLSGLLFSPEAHPPAKSAST